MKSCFICRVLLVFCWSLSLLTVTPQATQAGHGSCHSCRHCRGNHCCCCGDRWWSIYGSDRVFDGTTRAAWYQTWHGPNALATPLRPYYIPRDWKWCDLEDCDASENCPNGAAFPAAAAVGFEPMEFERLGRIPNDFALGGVAPAADVSR
jgi:hypothetical protein